MPRTKISEFSATAASNTDIDSINLAEGCAPSGINDAIRELMAQLKDFQTGAVGDSFNGPVGSTTAAAGAFTTLTASSTLGVTGVATLGAGAILNTPASVTLTNATGLPLTTGTTGTLATTKGGTGLTSFTSGGVVYASSTSALATGSALTFDTARLSFIKASNSRAWSPDADDLLAIENSTSANFDMRASTTGGSYVMFSDTDARARGYVAYLHSSDSMPFAVGGSEGMRLTSTGLGIGTSSPAYKLDVRGVTASGNGTITTALSYDSGGLVGTISNHAFGILTNSSVVARFDTSGNLGLGVTPSASDGTLKFVTVGNVGNSFAGFNGGLTSYVLAGAYYNAGWKYAVSSSAVSRYDVGAGTHTWYTAASGTAGNAITFTQAMTLDASGNLLVGTTTNTSGLRILASDGTVSTGFLPASTIAYTGTWTNHAFGFATNGTEKARIDTSGNLLVGTTSLSNRLSVVATSGQYVARFGLNGTGSQSFINFVIGEDTTPTGVGSVTTNGTITLYNTTSDQRLKENIQDADSASSLIDSLQVRQFDWKSDNSHQRYGFVAQELVTVAPEAVHQPADTEEMMAVDYSKLVPMLVKEIQSLRVRVAQLESN